MSAGISSGVINDDDDYDDDTTNIDLVLYTVSQKTVHNYFRHNIV